MTKTVVINGTNSNQSRVNGIASYIQKQADAQIINVYDLPAQDLISGNYASEAIQHKAAIVEQSDVVVILTPIYKASYTGILKTFLDLLPQKAFVNKIIVPIVVGGSERHQLVIDYALKPVAAALGATIITQGVFVHDKQIAVLNGSFTFDETIEQRINEQLPSQIHHQSGYVRQEAVTV
jgi:FMN reductase